MNLLINVCLVLFVLVAAVMVLVILMQRPKSEGLGAAFGAGVTENIFGAQTTNVLVKFTTWLAGIFFALMFALSVLYAHHSVASSASLARTFTGRPTLRTDQVAPPLRSAVLIVSLAIATILFFALSILWSNGVVSRRP